MRAGGARARMRRIVGTMLACLAASAALAATDAERVERA